MENKEEIYEIAILGRVTWDLHSLNNEGTVGNVTEPRTLVLADGTQTDGVSGEMLKHMHAENMWKLESDKTKFCSVCQKLWPERAGDVKGNIEEGIKEALNCEMCDIHGFLVPRAPNPNRRSTVEFGWAVGIPEVQRSIHVHSRVALHEARLAVEDEKKPGEWGEDKCSWERREGNKVVEKCTTNPNESMLYKVRGEWYCGEHVPGAATPQMVYHRPTRSGIYGVVSVFQPWRIGLNNINFNYDVSDDNERAHRYQLVLKAYQAMFMRPEGAMTSTRLPHTEKFEGVIVVSKINFPVPVISPLRDDYKEQLNAIKSGIDSEGNIEIMDFDSVSVFVEKIKTLLEKKTIQSRIQERRGRQ
jgi:CRISPR-associated protein Cst2